MTDLALRVAVPSGRHRDVLLDVPAGATVGDLAVALAAALGSRVQPIFRQTTALAADLALDAAGLHPGDIVGWGGAVGETVAVAAVVEVRAADGSVRELPVSRALVVGRGGADIDLADPAVSRRHALIAPAAGGVMITDLGGRNGTWIDDHRVNGSSAFAGPGAIVRVGGHELVIRTTAPMPAPAAWDAAGGVVVHVGCRAGGGAATVALGPGTGVLELGGARPAQLALARAIVVQLAAAAQPWHLVLLAGAGAEAWRWALWLPHLAAPFVASPRAVAGRPPARRSRLAEIRAEIDARHTGAASTSTPVVVVVDGAAPSAALADVCARGPAVGVYVVHLPGPTGGMDPTVAPDGVTRLSVGPAAATMRRPGAVEPLEFIPLGIPVDAADAAARARAAATVPPAATTVPPATLALPADPAVLASAWAADPAPLVVGAGDPTPVTIDLSEPGAHIVVRGDGRSGRTATLRMLGAAAAATFSPDRLRIVAVDPGGELTELRELPHTDWTVRRLDASVLQTLTVAAGPTVLVLIDAFDLLHADDSRLVARLAAVTRNPHVRVVMATGSVELPERLRPLFTRDIALAGAATPGVATLTQDGATTPVTIAHLPAVATGDPVPIVTALDITTLGAAGRPARRDRRYLSAFVDACRVAAALGAATSADPAPPRRVEPALRVLLVEDHGVLAEMIEAGLERGGCAVAATCATADDALAAVGLAVIDVAVVDVDLGRHTRAMPGVDVIDALRAAVPSLPVVAWSRQVRPDAATVGRVMRLAPEAFVCDAGGTDGLAGIVRMVAGGGRYLSPSLRPAGKPSAFEQMTAAEQRLVVELARHPDTRARLARRLHLSISTVDSHLRAVKRKVAGELGDTGRLPADGVVSTEALIGWAIEHGYDRAAAPAMAVTAPAER